MKEKKGVLLVFIQPSFQAVPLERGSVCIHVKVTVSSTSLKLYTVSSGGHIEVDYTSSSTVKVFSEAALEMSYILKYLLFFCKACRLSDVQTVVCAVG